MSCSFFYPCGVFYRVLVIFSCRVKFVFVSCRRVVSRIARSTGIHEKRRGEPKKNGEMDWVKLPSVTPLTIVKTVQCHTSNDGIPPRTSVFEARWIVTSQNVIPHSKEKMTLTNI